MFWLEVGGFSDCTILVAAQKYLHLYYSNTGIPLFMQFAASLQSTILKERDLELLF